jgi:hypothetical protein
MGYYINSAGSETTLQVRTVYCCCYGHLQCCSSPQGGLACKRSLPESACYPTSLHATPASAAVSRAPAELCAIQQQLSQNDAQQQQAPA